MRPYTIQDATADLLTALEAGNDEEVARLEQVVDRLDDHLAASLHASALWYAEQGLKVFPLQAGAKIPLKGSHGFEDATTDPHLIHRWWTGNPRANIGIATGHLIDVVDIDGVEGQTSRAKHWKDTFEQIDTDGYAKVLTPRLGGMHIYVPATGDGNSANIVPGVDYRGVGGYVVAPPSVNEVGRYQFLGTPRLDELVTQGAA